MTYINRIKRKEFGFGVRPRLGGVFKKIEAFQGVQLANGKVLEIAGTRRLLAGQNNLITTNGMNLKGTSPLGSLNAYCHIGTGTSLEVVGDTGCETWERVNDSVESNVESAQGSAPYYGSHLKVYRFDPPGTNKTYSEVTISPQNTNGNCFSRARIKSGGTPTTISVLAAEWLDITYELRLYPDHLTVGEDTVNGYDLSILCADVTAAPTWGDACARPMDTWTGGNGMIAYSGNASLGPVTNHPSAAENDFIAGATGTITPYVNDSYGIHVNYHLTINDGNFADDKIGAINFEGIALGNYQVLFDPPLPKTIADTVDVGIDFDWDRAVIP